MATNHNVDGEPERPAEAGGVLAVDAGQLARLLSVSRRHVERMDSAGKLPTPVRIGHSVRWPLDGPTGIREWLRLGCPDRRMFKALADAAEKTQKGRLTSA